MPDSLFWSVLLILVGVAILGVNLGVISQQVVRFWPMIFIIIGLVGLSGGMKPTGKKK